MNAACEPGPPDEPSLWDAIRQQLSQKGIELESVCCGEMPGARVKVVCVAPDMQASLMELGKTARDQVVMVRVDEETVNALDAWVESGALRSRSEAAAVFMRDGLKIRASELAQLKDALRDVEQAKQRLREKAREVFGAQRADPPTTGDHTV